MADSEIAQAQDAVLDHRSELEREADDVVRAIEGRIGHRLRLRVEIDDGIYSAEELGARFRSPEAQAGWQQWVRAFAAVTGTEPLASTVLAQRIDDVDNPGRKTWTIVESGPVLPDRHYCHISFTVTREHAGSLVRGANLAHELFHCFQLDLNGSVEKHQAMPLWLREGSAEWVGQTFVGGDGDGSFWQRYLEEPKSLFERHYDAMGFYSHLALRGTDVWRLLPDLIRAPNEKAAFHLATAQLGDKGMQTWPTGLARRPELGPEWDTTGPSIPSTRRTPTDVVVTPGMSFVQEIPPATQQLYRIAFPHEKNVDITIHGYGEMKWAPDSTPSGDVEVFTEYLHARYCVGDSCTCGTHGALPAGLRKARDQVVLIAITSGYFPGKISFNAVEPVCCPRTSATEPPLPSCLVGNWVLSAEDMVEQTTGAADEDSSVTHDGTITLWFGENGEFLKRYDLRTTRNDPAIRTTRSYQGAVAGCVEAKMFSEQSGGLRTKSVIMDNVIVSSRNVIDGRPSDRIDSGTPWNQWPAVGGKRFKLFTCEGDVLDFGSRYERLVPDLSLGGE